MFGWMDGLLMDVWIDGWPILMDGYLVNVVVQCLLYMIIIIYYEYYV